MTSSLVLNFAADRLSQAADCWPHTLLCCNAPGSVFCCQCHKKTCSSSCLAALFVSRWQWCHCELQFHRWWRRCWWRLHAKSNSTFLTAPDRNHGDISYTPPAFSMVFSFFHTNWNLLTLLVKSVPSKTQDSPQLWGLCAHPDGENVEVVLQNTSNTCISLVCALCRETVKARPDTHTVWFHL